MTRKAMIILSHTIREFTIIREGDSVQYLDQIEDMTKPCAICGKEHIALYVVERSLAETFGHFACFRLSGEVYPVDGTLPHQMMKLPRDSIRVPDEIIHYTWNDKTDSWSFSLRDSNGRRLSYNDIKMMVKRG